MILSIMANLPLKQKLFYYLWFGLVGLILAISIFFRGYFLSLVPASLNRDEAALAYNGLLLNQTGKDEWGITWPITPASFGDYKLIGYPALLAALFRFLPQHDWVVKLPSMLAGFGLIIVTLFIGRKIFTQKFTWVFIALVASAPALMWFSRSAWEANVALFYLVWAGYLFIFHQQANISIGRSLMGLTLVIASLLTYNTPLIIVPFLAILMPFIFAKSQLKQSLRLMSAILLVWSICLVLLRPALTQKSGITIFSDPTVRAQWLEQRADLPSQLRPWLGNYPVFLIQKLAKNTLAQLSPQFLAIKGDTHPWHALAGWGHVYIVVYLFAGLGLLTIAKKQKLLFGYLILVTSLPSIITVDAPHPTRSLLLFYLVCLLAVFGLRWTSEKISKIIPLVFLLIIFVDVARYSFQYFTIYPAQANITFQANFQKVINWLQLNQPTGDIAIVDSDGYQYILLAWYLKIDPEFYLTHNVRQLPDRIGLRYGERVGRFHFIVAPEDLADTERVLVYFDNQTKLWVVETR